MSIPAQYNAIMPYIMLSPANDFIDFAKNVFRADVQLIKQRPDGTVMHGELRIGDATVMFSDANESFPAFPCSLCLLVENADEIYARGIANGARSLQAPVDTDHGRSAGFADKFGNYWWLIQGIR